MFISRNDLNNFGTPGKYYFSGKIFGLGELKTFSSFKLNIQRT